MTTSTLCSRRAASTLAVSDRSAKIAGTLRMPATSRWPRSPLSKMTGLWPASLRRLTVCDPMYPAPPATSTFILTLLHSNNSLFRRDPRGSIGDRMKTVFPLRVLFLLTLSCASAAAAADVKPLAIGSAAPDFDLAGVDGRNHKLVDFAAASVLVVVFTCNHCPTAQAYEERLIQLADDYREKGVVLVAINPN